MSLKMGPNRVNDDQLVDMSKKQMNRVNDDQLVDMSKKK